MSVQANGVRGEVRSELRWNCTHAARGQNGIAFAEHYKGKFEHAIGGFQFAIEKNSAEKWTKKAMDEFFGETRGYQGIFRGALRALEDLLDRVGAQPGPPGQGA